MEGSTTQSEWTGASYLVGSKYETPLHVCNAINQGRIYNKQLCSCSLLKLWLQWLPCLGKHSTGMGRRMS
jgi:hypothetical protein